MIKVSVIIPALNEENYIKKTLKSINKQSIPRRDYEIILSDGKSKDKTIKFSKKYADKIISMKNKTISEARNIGASKAKGEYLVFIDADTTVSETLLESVIKALQDKNIVGGFVHYRFKTDSTIIKLLSIIFGFINYLTSLIIPKNAIVAGICLFARRSTFNKINGFDKTLVTSEDNDLAHRLLKKGKFVLINEYVYTSDRRLKKMGLFRLLKYYLTDYIQYLTKKGFKGNYIKVD